MMTIDDIKELIKIDETRCVELKKSTSELKDGSCLDYIYID